MKLSDAMILGSTFVKYVPEDWNTCALGVAGTAIGLPFEINGRMFGVEYTAHSRQDAIVSAWPWLDCEDPNPMEEQDVFIDGIWRRFDEKVCKGKMSMADLIEYVQSVEPECGECNRFACVCDLKRQAIEMSRKLQPVAGTEDGGKA